MSAAGPAGRAAILAPLRWRAAPGGRRVTSARTRAARTAFTPRPVASAIVRTENPQAYRAAAGSSPPSQVTVTWVPDWSRIGGMAPGEHGRRSGGPGHSSAIASPTSTRLVPIWPLSVFMNNVGSRPAESLKISTGWVKGCGTSSRPR